MTRKVAMIGARCSIAGCVKPKKGRGLCAMHYWRLRKYGDPTIAHPASRVVGSHLSPGSLASFRAKQFAKAVRTFWSRVNKTTTCWLWTGNVTAKGYGAASGGGEHTAHRVSWLIHFGPIPSDLNVLHHCDIRLCVRPSHLYLGTLSDNINDAYRRNRRTRHPWVGRPPSTQINEDIVRAIRREYETGRTQRSIALDLNISKHIVNRVVLRKTWAWVS